MPLISEFYAFVAEEEPGHEGLVAKAIGGQWMPFVCADKTRVDSLRPLAQSIAQATGVRIRLVRFHARTDLEVIGPRSDA